VIEGDRRNQFRLNPEIVVEATIWETSAKHPHEAVPNIHAPGVKRKTQGENVHA